MDTAELGKKGELEALNYLLGQGYRLIKKNHRTRLGEVDLIVAKEEFLVFVEVKTRKESRHNISPLLSVTPKKCQKIIQLCEEYRSENELYQLQPRFDVIGIIACKNGQFLFEHIVNAF